MVWPVGYYIEVGMTGQKRVRRGWFGKLILQVEVEQRWRDPNVFGIRTDAKLVRAITQELDMPSRKAWRDATASDMKLDYAEVKEDLPQEVVK